VLDALPVVALCDRGRRAQSTRRRTSRARGSAGGGARRRELTAGGARDREGATTSAAERISLRSVSSCCPRGLQRSVRHWNAARCCSSTTGSLVRLLSRATLGGHARVPLPPPRPRQSVRVSGLQDITAWVDFSACAEAASAAGFEVAGFTTQGNTC
jgi:hypothetical protein